MLELSYLEKQTAFAPKENSFIFTRNKHHKKSFNEDRTLTCHQRFAFGHTDSRFYSSVWPNYKHRGELMLVPFCSAAREHPSLLPT